MIGFLTRLAHFLIFLPLTLFVMSRIVYLFVNRGHSTLISSGEKRRYLLYVPKSYQPGAPTPLVISIHGFADWPAHHMQTTRWNALADKHGFIVVYPCGTGLPLRWRAGKALAKQATSTDPAPDVQFITDLIDHLSGQYPIDPRRIFVNGFSNGGGMTFVLSCALAERIASVGMVAGAYLYAWEGCAPSRPVPAIIFHGTADPIVPFMGGESNDLHVAFPPIPIWVQEYARRNTCSPSPVDIPARGQVSGVRYTGCAADVDFYTVNGGGHAWPGGKPLPIWITGPTTQDMDATEVMWAFFQAHPLEK